MSDTELATVPCPEDPPRRYFVAVGDGGFSPPSPEELADALQGQARREASEEAIRVASLKLAALKGACDHRVFYDTPGYPWDVRHCVCCGQRTVI
jgi:hypothetical protein